MKSPQRLYFTKANKIPNSGLPTLIFRALLPQSASAKARIFRRTFKKNGWVGIWTDTIYDYTHFHSNAHEVLGIATGKVTLRLGGEAGRLVRLKAGDMLVLPAGVGHRRISDDRGLKVVGAYPRGQAHFDMKRTGRAIPKVRLPETDPFQGESGPVIRIWSREPSFRN
jgi:uncharacterized protein YjlB